MFFIIWCKMYICNINANFFLTKHYSIRKSLTAFALVIFAFSIIPKKLLHHLFANHKDTRYKPAPGHTHQQKINTGYIQCPCDDLVVECPFISDNNIKTSISFSFTLQLSETTNSFNSSIPLSFGLRGPPAIA